MKGHTDAVNAVAYNSELDQILLTARSFDEFWIIDHSALPSKARPGLKRTRASPGTKSGRRRLLFVCHVLRVACDRDGKRIVVARIVSNRKTKIVAWARELRSLWSRTGNWGWITSR